MPLYQPLIMNAPRYAYHIKILNSGSILYWGKKMLKYEQLLSWSNCIDLTLSLSVDFHHYSWYKASVIYH